ncbi:fructose-1,6-bisphosphatase/inositol monophosphatase family enzyme [Aliiruegeria haliotis]|uniref:Fructose-1,6-bisphosphatase/inositol monophosphatase family enzyme n=1 Tax=Aliiruegeria haliotis TaxID=1280846 RepID=A0A2T0RY93_9RHOB|nr:inositol monophosphatase [Aliiruegeria haliotis]PRY26154.1 fructose-1,6-bisphosphatase/inositol monophosphatase family enzyme [Aliiruegeria haliotis]
MIPTQQQEQALIEAVRTAARSEILPRFRNLDASAIDSKANADDLVTVADKASEASITAAVAGILPGATVVGEEAVADDPALLDLIGRDETCVIVDPIDGTWNFAKGLPVFGVLLAVTHRGETVFGLLYEPLGDDWILARKGGGCWYASPDCAPRRLSIEPDDGPTEFAGFSAPWLLPEHMRERFQIGLLQRGRVIDLRCACQTYRTMCFGAGKFAIDLKLMPWDHAAGALAYQEAGGSIGLLDGRDYAPTITDGYMVMARTPEILADLRESFGWVVG